MEIKGNVALVTGGASGLGEATVRAINKQGGKVIVLDLDAEKGTALAKELNDVLFISTDVSSESQVKEAISAGLKSFGAIHFCINCAGICPAAKTLGKNGPHSLELFSKVIQINLIGSFNVLSLCAEQMANNQPNQNGERGVIINTASVAAFEGQIGQVAYAASKAGIAGITLPIARDLARSGIRVCSIAPGLFKTPMFDAFTPETIESLEAQVPFPSRLGKPTEYADLAIAIINNSMLNGETIRLDGAIRMGPR